MKKKFQPVFYLFSASQFTFKRIEIKTVLLWKIFYRALVRFCCLPYLLSLGSLPAEWKKFALLCTQQWNWEMNLVPQDLLWFAWLSEAEREFLKRVICWLLCRHKELNTWGIYGFLIIPSLLCNSVLVTIKCFACVYSTKYLRKKISSYLCIFCVTGMLFDG